MTPPTPPSDSGCPKLHFPAGPASTSTNFLPAFPAAGKRRAGFRPTDHLSLPLFPLLPLTCEELRGRPHWPPCPPRRRCGPCWTNSWALLGTVSLSGRPGAGRGREQGEAAWQPEARAVTVCACAGRHSFSPARRPQALGLCLIRLACEAAAAAVSFSSGRSPP